MVLPGIHLFHLLLMSSIPSSLVVVCKGSLDGSLGVCDLLEFMVGDTEEFCELCLGDVFHARYSGASLG